MSSDQDASKPSDQKEIEERTSIGAHIVLEAVRQEGEDELKRSFAEISRVAMNGGFWTTVIRGIFAGWLIALTVWLLHATESAKVSIIIFITYLVGLGGFAHVRVAALNHAQVGTGE